MVHQGLAVYGNKGSTDQHAYVQQLRDGMPDFFVTFVRVLKDGATRRLEVEPGVTSGDYLDGLLLGTRRALHESGRPSLTITIRELDPRSLGMLIALYERAVGLYASLVGINAYHQPGVEAGKKAAAVVLELQTQGGGGARRRGAPRAPPARSWPRSPERPTRSRRSSTCSSASRPTPSAASRSAPARRPSTPSMGSGLELMHRAAMR